MNFFSLFFLPFFCSCLLSSCIKQNPVDYSVKTQDLSPKKSSHDFSFAEIEVDPNHKLVKIARIAGGSTLSFHVTFSDRSQYIYKPEQVKAKGVPPRYELAAFLIAQKLGLKTVPPVEFQSFNFNKFLVLAKKDPELNSLLKKRGHELTVQDGKLNGILMRFIPYLKELKIDGSTLDSKKGIASWTSYLQASSSLPPDKRSLVTQISDGIVFDFLIGNQDRWSGMNILGVEKGAQISLVLIDNAMSFGRSATGGGTSKKMLMKIQSFSKDLLAKVKEMSFESLNSSLVKERGHYKFLIDKTQKKAFINRCSFLLEQIDKMKNKKFL